MAAVELRVVRRSNSSPQPMLPAITAASAPVTDPQKVFKTGLDGGRRNDWQSEAWEHYYGVGEIRYFVTWVSGSCARCKLIPSEIGEDGQPTGGISEDNPEGRKVAAVVRAIAGGPQGQAELIKRAAKQLSVPGEYWTAILQTKAGEKWFVITRDEIKKTGRTVTLTLPDGTDHEFNPSNDDAMYRTWNADPRKAWLPDSTVRGVASAAREIVQTDKTIAHAARSRLANNGILVVPSEANVPQVTAPPSAGKVGQDDEDPDEEPVMIPVAQGLQNLIVDVAIANAREGGGAGEIVPIVISAPAESIKDIKHILLSQEITATALLTRGSAIDRLAMGLDVSVERIKGMGDSNHWSTWAIGDEDVQLHVKPVMQPFCESTYANAVAPVLEEMGIDSTKYTLWFDAGSLTADPDKTDEAKDAFALSAITAEALVRYYGLSEDSMYDFDSAEGWAQWARDNIGKKPELIATLHVLVPELADIAFPTAQPELPPVEDDEADDESGADQEQEPETEDDDGDAGEAAISASGLNMLIDDRITRALGLAGRRRVSSGDGAQKARLQGIEPHRYHQFMPAVAEHLIGKLVRTWDDGLDELASRHRFDANQVRLLVMQEVRKQLTAQVVDA